MGKKRKIAVCGTVVSTRTSRSGNILMNLDKPFPDQIFTVFIRKKHIVNFSTDPEQAWINREVCVRGKVVNMDGVPAMFIEDEKKIELRK